MALTRGMGVVTLGGAMALALGFGAGPAAADHPTQPIELVIPTPSAAARWA